MPLAPGSRIGSYEVVALLGVGGMGEVYRARDTRLRRDVAIKILPPAFTNDSDRVQLFEREARVLASLNHPNIAAIYGLEAWHGGLAIVMELATGETIASRLLRGPIPAKDAVAIAEQMVTGLLAAHDKGILHRDLKPANITLRDDGIVKLLDFGLAKLIARDQSLGTTRFANTEWSNAADTQVGVVRGTLAYMSPEQLLGASGLDQRVDVWAFGCVLYEILTAKPAYLADSVSETMSRTLTGEPNWQSLPADLPQAIRLLLGRCLDKDVQSRLQDLREARLTLEEAAAMRSVQSRTHRFLASDPLIRAGGFSVAALAGVALLVLIGANLPRSSRSETSASSTPAAQSVDELIKVREERASQIFAEMDATRDELLTTLGDTERHNSDQWPPRVRELKRARNLFGELHQKHIAALRAGQFVLANEIADRIFHLLYLRAQLLRLRDLASVNPIDSTLHQVAPNSLETVQLPRPADISLADYVHRYTDKSQDRIMDIKILEDLRAQLMKGD